MKHCISISLLVFWTTLSFGQFVQRQDKETARQFAERLKPDNSTLVDSVIETKWNETSIIISLYDQTYKLPIENDPDQQTYHKIDGSVFIQLDKGNYRKTTFGTIDTEGDKPKIETVFFANVDTDKTKELIIIASWKQQHYDFTGTLYGTYVFEYELESAISEWIFLEEISRRLDGGCDCSWRDGTSKKAKFKTASEVKNELIRLGYDQ